MRVPEHPARGPTDALVESRPPRAGVIFPGEAAPGFAVCPAAGSVQLTRALPQGPGGDWGGPNGSFGEVAAQTGAICAAAIRHVPKLSLMLNHLAVTAVLVSPAAGTAGRAPRGRHLRPPLRPQLPQHGANIG